MTNDSQLIDAACMRFERLWKPEWSLGEIRSFLEAETLLGDSYVELATELFAIDLDRRWQLWGKKHMGELSPKQAVLELNSIPKAEEYIAALRVCIPNGRIASSTFHESDFAARQRHGDAIAPSAEVSESLQARFTEDRPRAIVRSKKEAEPNEFRFWDVLTIGRQSKEDQPPFSLSDSSIPKLICAPGKDRRISRNQLSIRILSRQWALIENTSHNRHVPIGRSSILAPASVQICKFPITIKLDQIIIDFYRR
ncbi:MAG: hypothetical protein AAF483_14255 [Planctomycetota bacterium]